MYEGACVSILCEDACVSVLCECACVRVWRCMCECAV